MPKFTMHDEQNFSFTLRNIGIQSIFDQSADFSGISDHMLSINGIGNAATIMVYDFTVNLFFLTIINLVRN